MKINKLYDGEYEIVYSNTFIIYDNHLKIKNIEGFEINFYFRNGRGGGKPTLHVEGNQSKKTVDITFSDYYGTDGAGTTQRKNILKLDNGEYLSFGLYITGFSDLLNVSVTFYKK